MNWTEAFLRWSTSLAAVTIAIFAAVQLYQGWRERRERKRAAYASLYAEYFQLWARSDSWQDEDLVAWARADALNPDELLPRDWGALLTLLGQVSTATAALGAIAFDCVAEAATRARMLVRLTNAGGGATRIAGNDARQLETQVKKGAREAATILEDALRCAPSWILKHKFTIVDPQSTVGKNIEQHLNELRKRLQPRRHEAVLGPVGRFLGAWLAKLASWLDPAACR